MRLGLALAGVGEKPRSSCIPPATREGDHGNDASSKASGFDNIAHEVGQLATEEI